LIFSAAKIHKRKFSPIPEVHFYSHSLQKKKKPLNLIFSAAKSKKRKQHPREKRKLKRPPFL
jgi:hypothetical protein